MSKETDNFDDEDESLVDKAKSGIGDARSVLNSAKNFQAEKAAAGNSSIVDGVKKIVTPGVPGAGTPSIPGVPGGLPGVPNIPGAGAAPAAASGAGAAGAVTAAAGGTSAAAAGTAAQGAAAAASGASAAAGGTVAAVEGAAGAAAGAAGAVLSAAGEVKGLVDSAKEGDATGAVDSTLRGAGIVAASVLATPAAGALVATALNTKPGRILSRGISKIVVAVVAFLLAIVLTVVTCIIGSVVIITGLVSTAESQCSSATSDSSGITATSAQEQVEVDIVSTAYSKGLGINGAVIGVMTGLTESNLTNGEHDATQAVGTGLPLLSAGVFQQKPWYWANEAWPAGTKMGSAAYNDPKYVQAAITDVTTTTYAAGKFFDKFNTDATLKNGAWEQMQPAMVAQTIQQSSIKDGSNYQKNFTKATADVNQVLQQYPDLAANTSAAKDTIATSTCNSGIDGIDASDVVLSPNGKTVFTTDTSIQIPNASLAVSNAVEAVNTDGLAFCTYAGCSELCDYLASREWGYSGSGYATAKDHWDVAVQTGVAHPGSTNVPIGALMFWDTGVPGHVAVYVGNGMVISNMTNSTGSHVYEVSADWWSANAGYYGWAMPVFRGPKTPGSGF